MSTFADMYGRVLRWADSNNTTEAKAHVNDTYQEVVRTTKSKVTKATKTLTVGTSSYDIISAFTITDLMAISYIAYLPAGGTDSYPIAPTSFEEILRLRTSSSTSGVLRLYALRDATVLELYPSPQSSSDQLDIYYVATPTALSADADLPSSVPVPFHDVITLGATARLLEDEDAGEAEQYVQKYQRRLNELTWFISERTGRIPRRTRLGYPTRRSMEPHDRSTYYSGES